ncbi:MAG: Hsp70 family protein [Myxococcales bacterium]|nr:Hsp70 family protein [Myxococcales bacterium]
MRLGIDLGTTRTIVAFHDRGNFPSVAFVTPEGDLVDHFPTVTAEVSGSLVHGLDAEAAEREGAPSLRSWKRLLASTRQDDRIPIGHVAVTPAELVTGFLSALRVALCTRSNVAQLAQDPLEAVISVPANAHSTQRFVTLDAFRRAGFAVRAVINEPSAAGIEYAHRHANTLSSRREHVVVYDLGGGTFDAALVHIAGGHHDVALTSGIPVLGGDDFDRALLDLALERAGRSDDPPPGALAECRSVKESIHANTKKIVVDLDPPIVIPVADYYQRVRPLVEATLTALEPIVEALTQEEGAGDLAGIYMVGGASGLPIVHRVVRERFGRRVHRSPQPAAATAIGGAILAVEGELAEPLALSERLSRHFGVFREAERGKLSVFDPVFEKGTPMPGRGDDPVVAVRRYRAAHNIGHFRFVESAHVDHRGDPTGDLTPHADVFFPFAADLAAEALPSAPVSRLPGDGPLVEERYEVDAAGVIAVTITDLDAGRVARFVL